MGRCENYSRSPHNAISFTVSSSFIEVWSNRATGDNSTPWLPKHRKCCTAKKIFSERLQQDGYNLPPGLNQATQTSGNLLISVVVLQETQSFENKDQTSGGWLEVAPFQVQKLKLIWHLEIWIVNYNHPTTLRFLQKPACCLVLVHMGMQVSSSSSSSKMWATTITATTIAA